MAFSIKNCGFFLIAGKLIKSGRKFILKLQEDWAYKEEYNEAERRLGAFGWGNIAERENGRRR